jgi:hypothetical protein
VLLPSSLPSRGVMGMRLLLESPAELAGLLSRSANGFRGGTTMPLPEAWRSADRGLGTDGGVRWMFETVTPTAGGRDRVRGRGTGSGSSLEYFTAVLRTTRTVVWESSCGWRRCCRLSSFGSSASAVAGTERFSSGLQSTSAMVLSTAVNVPVEGLLACEIGRDVTAKAGGS